VLPAGHIISDAVVKGLLADAVQVDQRHASWPRGRGACQSIGLRGLKAEQPADIIGGQLEVAVRVGMSVGGESSRATKPVAAASSQVISLVLAGVLGLGFLGIAIWSGLALSLKAKRAEETPIQAWWREELQQLNQLNQSGTSIK
jgi:hypothetical protein